MNSWLLLHSLPPDDVSLLVLLLASICPSIFPIVVLTINFPTISIGAHQHVELLPHGTHRGHISLSVFKFILLISARMFRNSVRVTKLGFEFFYYRVKCITAWVFDEDVWIDWHQRSAACSARERDIIGKERECWRSRLFIEKLLKKI